VVFASVKGNVVQVYIFKKGDDK
jgi:hypothetical protein